MDVTEKVKAQLVIVTGLIVLYFVTQIALVAVCRSGCRRVESGDSGSGRSDCKRLV